MLPLDLPLLPLAVDWVDCGSQPDAVVVLPVRLPKSANGSLLAVVGCAAAEAATLRWPLIVLLWMPNVAELLELIGVSGMLAALKLGSRLSNSDAVAEVLEVLAPPTLGTDGGAVDVAVKLAKSKFRLAAVTDGCEVLSEPNRSSMPLAVLSVLPVGRKRSSSFIYNILQTVQHIQPTIPSKSGSGPLDWNSPSKSKLGSFANGFAAGGATFVAVDDDDDVASLRSRIDGSSSAAMLSKTTGSAIGGRGGRLGIGGDGRTGGVDDRLAT